MDHAMRQLLGRGLRYYARLQHVCHPIVSHELYVPVRSLRSFSSSAVAAPASLSSTVTLGYRPPSPPVHNYFTRVSTYAGKSRLVRSSLAALSSRGPHHDSRDSDDVYSLYALSGHTSRRALSTSSKPASQSVGLPRAVDPSGWLASSNASVLAPPDMAPASATAHDTLPIRPTESGSFDFLSHSAQFTQPRTAFRFDHAVAGFAKHPNRPVPPDTEVFLSERFGEDACFRRHDSLGVADGVGGITLRRGGDSALMSRKLLHYSCMELERYDNIEDDKFATYYDIDPVDILERGYNEALLDMQKLNIEGATTACLVVLRDDELRVANLGDSGVLVIRQGDFVFRTEAQQRSFNFPYQLGNPSRDKPTEAQNFAVKLERGDIVILATDGMFDNLFDEDIVDEVTKCIRSDTRGRADPVRISQALAGRARDVSEDSRYSTSPFQSRAVAEGFYYQGGGKLDDITVVVAVVSDLEDTPDRR